MTWTRAIHLIHWADTQEARHTLPLLVRSLIRRTVPSLQALNFPAGEQVQRPGFDGVVEALQGNEFVPTGLSRWEMGVDQDPKGKAEKDFTKRTEDVSPEEQKRAVFVFVTPRTWTKKDEWAKEKRTDSNCHWRDVVVLDANNLEHWLEIAPAVDIWFSRLTGRATEGVQDFQSYWKSLQALAEYQLKPSVFTVSREPEIAAVRKWLAGPADSLFLKTYGLTEGIDFVAALSASEENEKLQNGVIVYTLDAWRYMASSREKLLLAAWPTLELDASDTAGAVSAGHHVLVSGPHGVPGQRSEDTLRRQDHYLVGEALRESGFSDAPAMSLGTACCGSSSILKRLITRHPETRFPVWCSNDVRPTIAPFALIGGWSHVDPEPCERPADFPFGASPPLDLWVVTELVGCTREQLEGFLARWQRDSEPLFLRFGRSVLLASREDSWFLLGGSITEAQIKRFRDLALLVLDEDNPAFELAPDQRWLANLYGKTHSLSGDLRRSLIETLALMATYPTAEKPDAGVDFKGTVRSVLEQALPRGASWQRWATFGYNLTIIAEADPELFLSRAEEDLRSSAPELPKLFQDKSHSVFGGAIHSDLLWALESLAWNPEYLLRVAVILARLAARDPGGTYSNRPGNSLVEIFRLWLWHTNASLTERIRVMSKVVEVEPEVGWKLICDLLPKGTSDISHNSHMPRWRPWAEGWSRERLRPQIFEYFIAVANLTIQLAGSDARRWSQVVDGMLRFNPEISERVFAALDTVQVTEANREAVFSLWEMLRELAARHERFSDAGWAFPQDIRERIAAVRDRLQPGDPVLRHQWLFGQHVELAELRRTGDFQAHDRAVHALRIDALREIISAEGAGGVFRLLCLAQNTYPVGWIIGREQLLGPVDVCLPGILDSTDNKRLGFIEGYISGRYSQERFNFVNSLPVGEWTAYQVATFARCLPFGGEVWGWLKQYGAEAENEYWRSVRGHLREPDLEQVQTACRSLIKVGRPFTAVDVLHMAAFQKLELPSTLVAEVLEATYTVESSGDLAAARGIHYDVQQLIKRLQQDESFDRGRLAVIEWGLLPFLDRETSEVGPDTLVRAVATEPDFYVQLLKLVFRGENDPPSETPLPEHERVRANRAHEMLDGLARLPGTNEQGELDHEHLRRWTEEVRSKSAECERLKMCDLSLGELFARASKRREGNWPSPEVAALMEDVGTERLFQGFENGVLKSRGVVSRNPLEGGELERRLAARYRDLAEHARPSSPKLAETFLRLADYYEREARHEDEDSERRKLGR